ncbi:hypothetical protein K466DRAFT_564277 [Polyporus arcularius HHB13444]|uniref:Uncharacterized protein n=1 Tax=Polyporus arcularius HHB13444 TaxID=1314778 RepID=A0A5C3PHE6_9APHY|nr:hypothetical protein K466DRAFT_564277 [Polyporus arcularius HHB13444]
MPRPTRLRENEDAYLETRQGSYRTTPGREKDAFVDQCARHILTLREVLDDDSEQYKLLLELFSSVRNWFNNRTQAKKARLPLRINRAYTGERVFESLCRDEIRASVQGDDSDEHHIVLWNARRKELWEALSQDERDEYEAKAVRWNEEGPDVQLPPALAYRRAIGWMRSVVALYWEQCRMPVIVYGLCPNDGDVPQGIRYDTSELLNERAPEGVPRRPEYSDNADWDQGLRRNFRLFFEPWVMPNAAGVAGETSTAVETNRRAPEEFEFETYDDGTPILVDTENGTPFTYLQRIAVFRQYVRAHYSCAKGYQVKYAPWGSMHAHPEYFFDDGMLPAGFHMRDPSHIHENDLINFFRHVISMEHPANGEDGTRFRFKCYEVGKKNRKKYLPAIYDGRPSDAAPGCRKKRPIYRRNGVPQTESNAPSADLPGSQELDAQHPGSKSKKPSMKAAKKPAKARKTKASSSKLSPKQDRKGKGKAKASHDESDEAEYTDGQEPKDITHEEFPMASSDEDSVEEVGFEDELVEGSEDFFDSLPDAAGPSKRLRRDRKRAMAIPRPTL